MNTQPLSTRGRPVARESHAWVNADELSAAVDAVWHQDHRGTCLHPVLGQEDGAVEYFTRCRVDPRLGWLGGRLRAWMVLDGYRAVWGLVVEPSRPTAYQLFGGSIPWDTEQSTWLRIASITPPPPEPLALAVGDPFDPAAWESFIRRQARALHWPRPVSSVDRADLNQLRVRAPFTAAALKAAYRKAALAAHPDRGGSAARFVAVREAFERLAPHATGGGT